MLFLRLRRTRKRMQTRMRKMRRLATPPSKVSRVTVSNPGSTRPFGLVLLSATCRSGEEKRGGARKRGPPPPPPPAKRRALRSSSRGSPPDPEPSPKLFDDHSLPVKEFCGELFGTGSRFSSKEFSPNNGKLSTGENVEGEMDVTCGLAKRLWTD